MALVNESVLLTPEKQILNHLGVIGTRSALETIDAQAQSLPLAPELGRDNICKLLWRFAGSGGGALDFLPVFVRAGGKNHVIALHFLEAADRIGGNRSVRVADMRRGICVINGCC